MSTFINKALHCSDCATDKVEQAAEENTTLQIQDVTEVFDELQECSECAEDLLDLKYENKDLLLVRRDMRDNYDDDVILAAIEAFGADWAADALNKGAYQGCYKSLADYAESYLDDTGMIAEVPESLRNYIDFDSWAKDCERSGDITSVDGDNGIYIFSANC